jgi:hypothetical protein
MKQSPIGTSERRPWLCGFSLGLTRSSRYCGFQQRDPVKCLHSASNAGEAIRDLKAFFSWRCDLLRNKNGRRMPGIKYKRSLESFWRYWHLYYTREVGCSLARDTRSKLNDVSNRFSILST